MRGFVVGRGRCLLVGKDFLSIFRPLWKKRRIYLREGLVVGSLIILNVPRRHFENILTVFRPFGKSRRIGPLGEVDFFGRYW